MKEEVIIGPVELGHVGVRDLALVVPLAAPDPLHEDLVARLEVDDQIGVRHLLLQHAVELLVQHELGIGEIQVGENLVLRKDVIAEGRLPEKVPLGQLLLLAEAVQEEEELALESRAGPVLVEVVQEGVLDVFENLASLQAARKELDEARLADADGSLDGDELEIHPLLSKRKGRIIAGRLRPRNRRAPAVQSPIRSTRDRSGQRARSSATVIASSGWIACGAISARGTRTKRLRCIRG